MERSDGNAAWAGQVSSMIEGLSPDDAGQLLVQLADGYRKAGRLDLAADTYFMFVRRCPDHALADQSLEWLIKFYASSETAHRLKTTLGEPASAGGQHAPPPLKSTVTPSNKPPPSRQSSPAQPARLPFRATTASAAPRNSPITSRPRAPRCMLSPASASPKPPPNANSASLTQLNDSS